MATIRSYPGMDVTEFGDRPQAPASRFNPPTLTDVVDPVAPPGANATAPVSPRNAGIPGMEVSEPAPMTANQARLFNGGEPSIIDPGPGNPNVGAKPPVGTYGKPLTEAPVAVPEGPGFLSRLGSGLGRTLGVGGVGFGSYEAATGLRNGDYGQAGLGAADAVASGALASGVGTLPAAAYLGGRAAIAGGNAIYDALPRGVQDAIGGTINNVVGGIKYLSTGKPVFDGATDKQVDDYNALNATLAPRNAAAGPVAANAGATSPRAYTPFEGDFPSTGSAQPSTAVTGAPGVRKVVGTDGRTLYTNVDGENTPGFGVSTIGGGREGMERNLRAADIYASMHPADQQGGGQGGSYIPGVNAPRTQYEINLEKHNNSFGDSGGPNRAQRAMAEIAARKEIADNTNKTAITTTGMNNSTSLATTGMNNNTSVKTTGMNNSTTARGQDLSYDSSMYGHQATAANARARLGYEIGKDQRDYALREKESNLSANEKTDAANTKHLETLFRTTDPKTGASVPDANVIAGYTKAVDTTVGELAKETRARAAQVAAQNPQLAQALTEKATALETRKAAALTPEDHNGLAQLFAQRERMRATAGKAQPGTANFVDSNNLLDYRQRPGDAGVRARTLGGNRIVTQGGGDVSANDLAYTESANAFLPDWFKTRSNDLTRGLRLE